MSVCRALSASRAALMLPIAWLIHMKKCAMETYWYARSLRIINACMYMHVFSLKYEDERICIGYQVID